MADPIRKRQMEELDTVTLCQEILVNARNELYLNMRFLDLSLSSLSFQADFQGKRLGTDGFTLFYQPQHLCSLYTDSRILVNRAYLHVIFHCLFLHLDKKGRRAEEYWNLACDIAVESIIDGLYLKCIHVQPSFYRRDIYQRLRKDMKVLTAEGIYLSLQKMELSERQYLRMVEEYLVDDHSYWYEDDSQKQAIPRQNRWNDNREKMQTNMEAFAQEQSEDSRDLMEQVQVENRERYDYKQFLRKFAVLKEEMEVDPDSFDPIFYTYGLSHYGNMPLIEPLESREISRIQDFVIAIDTSMSCSGELVRRFLEETYGVLMESESYFKKIRIHIIQCDDKIQADHVITSQEEMESYMEDFTIVGQGGTDFRPVFEYVNGLMAMGEFHRLRGLLYFTDGRGIYPVKRPVYDTAFLFVKDQYEDESVPPWAMKIILTPEELQAEEHLPSESFLADER
ncbi:MAG: VWA-like domain-containing protein [Lachnospiraceae bacterium]